MHNMNASHLTVRNLPEEVAAALARERHRRGVSLNQTVIDLLRQSLGITGHRSNGVRRLAGTWTEQEHREFLAATAAFEKIDEEFWS
jgi:plasmid stability protein